MERKLIGRSSTRLLILLIALTGLGPSVVSAQTSPQSQNTRSAAATSGSGQYYFEFRSRQAWDYGHTFVVHGRVGEPLTRKSVVGLHPAGDSGPWMIGHLVPVPSETGWSDGDVGYNDAYITAKYRVYLTEAEYRNSERTERPSTSHHPISSRRECTSPCPQRRFHSLE